MTPLHIACEKGSFEIVELLINKGADINAKTIIYSNFHFFYQILFHSISNIITFYFKYSNISF